MQNNDGNTGETTLYPCADCGATVDIRELNSIPIYAAILCEQCLIARDEARRCAKCKAKYQDKSLDDFTINPRAVKLRDYHVPRLVERRFRLRGSPYLCSWCALLQGDMGFIEKRTPRKDRDEKILTARLGLVKPRAHGFPTAEELELDRTELPAVEWLFLPRHAKDITDKLLHFKGEDIAEKYKHYFIRYAGYVCGESSEPDWKVDSPYFLIYHPENARKIVHICRIQIFHEDSQGYFEAYSDEGPWPRSFNLMNLNPKKAAAQAKELVKVRQILFELEREYAGGRPKLDGDGNAFDFVITKGKGLYASTGEVTKHKVARACGGNFGISAEGDSCIDKCAGCQAIDRLIARCNSSWGWKSHVLSRIKQS